MESYQVWVLHLEWRMLSSMEKVVIISLEEYEELKVIKSDFTSELETAKGLIEDELKRKKDESVKSLERQYKRDLEHMVRHEVDVELKKASDGYERTYNRMNVRIRKLDADVKKAYEIMLIVGAICLLIGVFLGSALNDICTR